MEPKQYPQFEFSDPLSQKHVDFFEQYGFIHFKNFITPHAINLFQQEIKTIGQKWVVNNVEKINGVLQKI